MTEKKVDEGWKESIAQEKEKAPEMAAEEHVFDFRAYITSLAMQALIFLGVIPNPLNEEKIEKNLDQARLLIDTLAILKEKTQGNLTKEEEDLLNTMLYELQMKFVEESSSASGA
jgi:hypothetical protein